jgi:hypothetical protein
MICAFVLQCSCGNWRQEDVGLLMYVSWGAIEGIFENRVWSILRSDRDVLVLSAA